MSKKNDIWGFEILSMISNLKDDDIENMFSSNDIHNELICEIIEDYLHEGIISEEQFAGTSVKEIMLKDSCDFLSALNKLMIRMSGADTIYIKN